MAITESGGGAWVLCEEFEVGVVAIEDAEIWFGIEENSLTLFGVARDICDG